MKKKHTKRKTDPEELAKIRHAVETYRKMLQYKRGECPPHYPVPAIRCDLVIWCADQARSKPHGLSIISDNGKYIEEITYSYGKTFGYGVALANL